MELRWSYDGASKDCRGLLLFSPNPYCPPTRRATARYCNPTCTLMDAAAPKRLHPSCGARTARSRAGARSPIRFPAKPKLLG